MSALRLAARLGRALGAASLAFATAAWAGPPAGTAITNSAAGTGLQGATPMSTTSNPVSFTVGAAPSGAYSAVLSGSTTVMTSPNTGHYFPHALTNTGTLPDTYTLVSTDLAQGFSFASIALLPDANGDGTPDSMTPLAGAIALAPGQAFRFVVSVKIPAAPASLTGDSVRVNATSAGGAAIAPVLDTANLADPNYRPDCGAAFKFLSAERGPSPGGPITVSLNYRTCDQARSRLVLQDRLPAGMRYVADSGRWSGSGAQVLTDAVAANDRQGAGTTIAYDFGVTAAGTVTAVLENLPAEAGGTVTFQVQIAEGLDKGTRIDNQASYLFYDLQGNRGNTIATNAATYEVTGRVDLRLVGDRVGEAMPGETVSFTNRLTNLGDAAERFDISLGGSTFPPGTRFALFQADGVTALSDTDGNATPDTGLVAPGASYAIVVRATLPETAPPGEYKVTKTARSAAVPLRAAAADDVVASVGKRCRIELTPDNQSQGAYGHHVTYAHLLRNRGNCDEPVRVAVGFLADSRPGWASAAYIDNNLAGGASIPGVVDRTDTPVVQGWTALVGPGQALRILVDVTAPDTLAGTRSAAKALVEANVTTLTIDSATGGSLKVVDTTTIDDKDATIRPQGVIRNFTDSTYAVSTAWAVLGGTAWLRADAASCNADPAVAETRTVVVTGPGGEREEVTATETGPDTGIFVAPSLAVRAPPVAAGDGVLEGRAFDVLDAEILGCGRRIATVVTLTEPAGVVFDSASNDPVAGAAVTLVPAAGGQCSTTPVAIDGNPATTGADGRYAFAAAPAGDYCLRVTPPNGYAAPSRVPYGQLVPGRNLAVAGPTSGGSYGGAFHSAGPGIVVDAPVDPAAQSGLFVQKSASRPTVDLGGFVDYAVRVRNGTGNALDRASVQLVDDLPAGFAYVRGTARSDGRDVGEPASGGPRLVFGLGHLAAGQEASLTYRVRVGPGAKQGDGTNRAQATYTARGATTVSNVATARVDVQGGVFSDRGYILGKVFLDCNGNGLQDAGEAGVPGVRLLVEDGTWVLTDGEGRYSFYGLPNRTHVLKADATTLPAGARLAITSARNLGDAASRVVDLKEGEMHRGDFAVAGCEAAVLDEVKARTKAAGSTDSLAALAGTQLATEARPAQDVKALPASGVVSATAPVAAAPSPDASRGRPFAPVAAAVAAARPTPAPALPEAAASVAPAQPLEALVPGLDKSLGFVGLKEGDTLPFAQATIRVKGTAGSSLVLAVNGAEVPASRIGKRSVLAEKQVQALEYVGVELKPGANELTVSQRDAFGNARGAVSIRVNAPGRLGRLVVEVPREGAVADGKTPVPVVVKVMDGNGVPVTSRTPVTLSSSIGVWKVDDPDPAEPGVQAFVEGGRARFELLPPREPASTQVVVTSGALKAEARLDFLPELRSLVAAGVVEGIVNLRGVNSRALVPARAADGFEQELRHLSREWNGGKGSAGGRAAFYLKGKIKGDYLLTASYDSDKDTRERLFRDIQPDEFYPVYGDSATRGYDAQSTSKLYVRVDRNRSYVLWGDFTTQAQGDQRRLSSYSRSLTGVKEHFESERVSANVFASRDTTRQVIEELRANGTSGPYELGTRGALVNSEKVEIVTRDRNQPAIVLSSLPQARFGDYEIEPLTGRILFRSPVSSVDKDLNPVFVRVTYEVDQGGQEFWVAGGDAQVRLTDRIEVGGTYVKDRNPQAPFTLAGANAVVKVGESTVVVGEMARTENGADATKGDAARLEVKHESKDLKAQAFVARSDRGFNNPGAWLSNGRAEAGGRAEFKVREGTLARAEALRTEDTASGSVRDGAMVAVTQEVAKSLNVELGLRYAADKGTQSPVPAVAGQPAPQAAPEEVTTARARVTGQLPFALGASVYGEAEVDVRDADRRILALGGEYPLPNRGRVYARHEFVSSITGPYGLNATERQNTSAIGIDMDYMKDGRLFSEYRIRDAMSGGDAEAALGLKNLWTLAPGLRLGTSIERVHALSGTGQNENTAGAVSLEYTASPLWKGSTRLELRDAATSESLLFTVGLAAKLDRDWTALARNAYSVQRAKDGGNEKVVERMQAGLAWRDTATNRWNALGRVEHRLEQDDTQAGIQLKSSTTLLSLHADWQLSRPFLVSGRYAAKWTTDKSNGLATKYRAQVVGGRATWEFAPRWDLGFVTSLVVGDGTGTRQYGMGLELGYLVTTNLWVSAGYNFFGYRDADLAGADYTARGPYVRLRYKFDETALEPAGVAGERAKAREGAR